VQTVTVIIRDIQSFFMTAISLYFKVHQPYRLKKFRAADVSICQGYEDAVADEENCNRLAEECYLPANEIIYNKIIEHNGYFAVNYSISGILLELLLRYRPDVIQSFKKLASTGCVEFLAETYYHSLASLHSSAEFERQVLKGELQVDLIPQGTLATRIQMAAMGIPAFYTPAGYGTEVAAGKETREFGGKMYLMETALHADFAIVKAWKGDSYGNLVFRKTTRNFSVPMAKAGTITIAEVEQLVAPGELDPDCIHVAGIYVHRIFQGAHYEKRIERKTVRLEKR